MKVLCSVGTGAGRNQCGWQGLQSTGLRLMRAGTSGVVVGGVHEGGRSALGQWCQNPSEDLSGAEVEGFLWDLPLSKRLGS